jgi:8-oxo-dGTP pyrophosphatase MutT (NUDIX family)
MSSDSCIPIESPGINIATIRRDGDSWKFLLVKRADAETYPGYWGLVTGGREGDETVPQLAVRELAEETGLRPERLWASEYCMQFYEPTVDRVWVLPVIVAVVSPAATVTLSEENAEYHWLMPEEAKKLVAWHNLRTVIDDISRELKSYPSANWVELPIPY